MNDYLYPKKYIELYKDFLHPNPNINDRAFLFLRKEFSSEFMESLLLNLGDKDIILRRKSIFALGNFGEEVLKPIVSLYLNSNNKIVQISCLKTIIKVIVNCNLKELNEDIMSVVDIAIKDNSPEIILIVISLIRQLGINGKEILMKTSRDKNILRAKASISALLEIKDSTLDDFFNELLNDNSIDLMIKEDIKREKII